MPHWERPLHREPVPALALRSAQAQAPEPSLAARKGARYLPNTASRLLEPFHEKVLEIRLTLVNFVPPLAQPPPQELTRVALMKPAPPSALESEYEPALELTLARRKLTGAPPGEAGGRRWLPQIQSPNCEPEQNGKRSQPYSKAQILPDQDELAARKNPLPLRSPLRRQ